MSGLQSMSTNVDRTRLRRLAFLIVSLFLVLQFPGEPTHAASLPTTSVSLQISNPACFQVLPASGMCSLQIGSLTASGSDSSFSRVEVLVNGKLRVYMGGFFESSANLTNRMMPGGLAVVCGRPNDGGSPDYGKAYSLMANAYMGDGTSSSDSTNVFCPAYTANLFLPIVHK